MTEASVAETDRVAELPESALALPSPTMPKSLYASKARQISLSLSGPPLLPGESAADYEAVLDGVFAAIDPRDAIEAMYAKDLADHIFEVERLKRLRTASLRGEFHRVAVTIFTEHGRVDPREKVSLLTTNDNCDKYLVEQMRKYKYNENTLMAGIVHSKVETLEMFQRLSAEAERRRDYAIDRINLYRSRKPRRERSPHQAKTIEADSAV